VVHRLAKVTHDIRAKYGDICSYLNERSRRIWAATEARSLGRGGITVVAEATGIDPKTIRKGLDELEAQPRTPLDRIRAAGGGRKKLTVRHRKLSDDLEALLEPDSRGDPLSPLRWTSKSTYKLTEALKAGGYSVSQRSVCGLLAELGYSLQANRKVREGTNHPDRDAQFHYIYRQVQFFQGRGSPVISVDTKKKELIGEFKNGGREYHPQGRPVEVNVHDFADKNLGKVSPYGVYDLSKNQGWVSVGISADTAEFAVHSIRCWWTLMGKGAYPQAHELLITADCGGSNGSRVRLWKVQLQKLATELGMPISVCHFPPGTSKWNQIEHKLFSYISQNWRGKPLLDRETVVQLIANTKTTKGLQIRALLDENHYEKGIKVTEAQMTGLHLTPAEFHGDWNYTIEP
jgi:hypothetical protein